MVGAERLSEFSYFPRDQLNFPFWRVSLGHGSKKLQRDKGSLELPLTLKNQFKVVLTVGFVCELIQGWSSKVGFHI